MKLKEENSRLKEALDLHRFCSVSVQPEVAHPFEIVSALTKTPQLKIIPFDPREILRIQSEQFIRQRPGNEVVTGPRDILREATEHILLEAEQPQRSHGGVLISVGGQQLSSHHQQHQQQQLPAVMAATGTRTQQQPQPQDVLLSSPGFVRVTPNYISVKSPLVKKSQKVKKTS